MERPFIAINLALAVGTVKILALVISVIKDLKQVLFTKVIGRLVTILAISFRTFL
jgi:hypothetical protein